MRVCFACLGLVVAGTTTTTTTSGFVIQPHRHGHGHGYGHPFVSRSETALHAIGVLAKKAKEAEIRSWVESGVPDDVMATYKSMTESSSSSSSKPSPGPVQESLTKRKGTITIIAEYKRRMDASSTGLISDVFDPDVLSSTYREFGAQAVAVMTDSRMGGCTYQDLQTIAQEQASAQGDMPGPLPVICSDLIVDQIQLARAKANGAHAVLLRMDLLGSSDLCQDFIHKARTIDLECMVQVNNNDEAAQAIQAGATMLCLVGPDPQDKINILEAIKQQTDQQTLQNICIIGAIAARNNNQLEEVEEAWLLRDKGFQGVWAAEVLYKAGNDPLEHAGAIIRSMKAKSSVKWASAVSRSGKGEGAREYLGDIMM